MKKLSRVILSLSLAACLVVPMGLFALPQSAEAAGTEPVWTFIEARTYYDDNPPQYYTEMDTSYTDSSVRFSHAFYRHFSWGDELEDAWIESYSWSAPPQTIKIGQEDKVAINMTVGISDAQGYTPSQARLAQGVHYEDDDPLYSTEVYVSMDWGTWAPKQDPVQSNTYPSYEPYFYGYKEWPGYSSKASICFLPDDYPVTDTDIYYPFRLYSAENFSKSYTLHPKYTGYWDPAKFNALEYINEYMDKNGESGLQNPQFYVNWGLVITVHVGEAGVARSYYYTYDPYAKSAGSTTVVTNTTASNTSGEDKGASGNGESGIPIPAIVIGLIAFIGGGIAIGKAKSNKGDGKKTPPDKPSGKKRKEEEKEEEKPESSFRMIVWKNFGDTLFVGDAPQQVGARIEETTPEGAKVDRPDLTARISISGSENIRVGQCSMGGRYMTAPAEALPRDGEAAYDGIITITFTGNGGTLVNNVTFHIKNEQAIVFAEEALTFIAGKKQKLAMPFGITGVNMPAGTEPTFQVEITTADAPFADVHIERDPDYPQQLWNVVMTETGIPEGQKDSLPAGHMETLNCVVKAYVPGCNPDKPLVGEFAFYRFHEGIRLSVQHLRAYVTVEASEYTQTDANTFAARAAMNSLSAASGMGYLGLGGDTTAQVVGLGMGLNENKAELVVLPSDPKNPKVNLGRASATVAFYTWDEETGRVINPVPFVDVKAKPGETPKKGAVTFTFEDIPGSCNLKDKDDNDVSKPCETLKFFAFPTKLNRNPHNEVVFSIIPTKGLLTPPNRSQARVTVSLEWKGQTFTAEETVNVLSQPYRADADLRMAEYEERDKHIFERLTYIQKKILLTETRFERSLDGEKLVARNPYDGMMPVYHRIEAMLEGYDPGFGYYEPDYERIESLFNQYTTGALGTTAAADCAFYGRVIENSDALLMTVADFNRSWTLIGVRIGFAVVTKGTSEGLFMAIQAEMAGFEAALKAADKGDDALEIFRVGCSEAGKTALIDYSLGKILEGGFAVAGTCAKALCSTASKAKAALMQKLAKGFSTASSGAKVQGAAKALGGEIDDAAKAARELVERYGKGIEASKEMTERDIAYCLGRIEGKVKVGNYAEALKDWKSLNRFEQYKVAFAIQNDKHAMRAMMEMKGEAANTLRAHFNAVVGEAETKGLKMARVKIAGELKTDPKNIRIKKTSGNKAGELTSGKKSSMDMDATFEQFVDGKWVDVPESIGQTHFNREMFKVVNGYEAASDEIAAQFAKNADLSIVDAMGLESYGTYADAMRVVQANRAAEVFDNAARVGATAEYKCEHWLDLARSAMKDANEARLKGDLRAAQALASASESFAEEAGRQFVKQYDRIVVNKLGVLKLFGVNPEMATLKKAAEVIRLMGIEKNGGITSAQADIVLEKGLSTDLKSVFHWLNEATVELDKQLQNIKK